jgi:lysophospholipase L1-like esterase
MLRGLWLRLAAAGVGLLVALLLAEVGLRLFAGGGEPRRSKLLSPSSNPELGYVLVPGATNQRVSINALGFRGREVDLEKPAGSRRIVVLGDSLAFGLGVEQDEPFPAQLGALFARAGSAVEVLNLGVPGYDVLNEVGLLAEQGRRLEPDIVVVGFCINDVGVHSANVGMMELSREHGWLIRRSELARTILSRVDRSALERDFHALNEDAAFRERYRERIAPLDDDPPQRRRISELHARLGGLPGQVFPFTEWYASPDKIGRLRYAFERLASLAREHRFEVWVAIIPYLDERGHPELYRSVYDIVDHEAARAGFRVVRLRDTLAERGLTELRQRQPGFEDPIHPTAEGHGLIARELFEALRPYAS